MSRRLLEYGTFGAGLLFLFWQRRELDETFNKFYEILGYAFILLWLYKVELDMGKKSKDFDSCLRKSIGYGLWCTFHLPFALSFTCSNSNLICSEIYRTVELYSIPLIITTLVWIYQSVYTSNAYFLNISSFFVNVLLVYYNSNYVGFINVIICTMIFQLVFWRTFHHLIFSSIKTFSMGEVIVLAQGCSVFCIASYINLTQLTNISNIVGILEFCQISNLGAGIFALVLVFFPICRQPKYFFALAAFIGLGFIIPAISHFVGYNVLIWLFTYFFNTTTGVMLIVHLLDVTALTVLVIALQTGKSTTITRKSFHLLFILAYLPLMAYHIDMLFLTSSVLFGIFVIVECIRIQKFPPFGDWIHSNFLLFISETSESNLIIDHITLLLGCSIPIWLFPMYSTVSLAVFSGILSVGIGDSLASIGGSLFGTHYWPGVKRTWEGTAFSIIGQVVVFLPFWILGYSNFPLWRFIPAIILTSLLEAFTSQVDNLVLPLFLYSLLIV